MPMKSDYWWSARWTESARRATAIVARAEKIAGSSSWRGGWSLSWASWCTCWEAIPLCFWTSWKTPVTSLSLWTSWVCTRPVPVSWGSAAWLLLSFPYFQLSIRGWSWSLENEVGGASWLLWKKPRLPAFPPSNIFWSRQLWRFNGIRQPTASYLGSTDSLPFYSFSIFGHLSFCSLE